MDLDTFNSIIDLLHDADLIAVVEDLELSIL